MVAANNGYVGVVGRLLEAGANVEAADNEGFTALMSAASNGHIEVISKLVQAGADVTAKDTDGWTALMLAAKNGRLGAVERVLDLGADVDETQIVRFDWIPLMGYRNVSCATDFPSIIRALQSNICKFKYAKFQHADFDNNFVCSVLNLG